MELYNKGLHYSELGSDLYNNEEVTKENAEHFFRGLWDGTIEDNCIVVKHNFIFNLFSSYCNVPFDNDGNKITFNHNCLLDFVQFIYRNKGDSYDKKKYKRTFKDTVEFECIVHHEDAVVPSKRLSDAGFDLTAINLVKTIGSVNFYDTGISLVPKEGYYFKLYPRSSISKTGYSLANSVGVIDSGYTGNIIIALRKESTSVKDLELPCRIAQLVPEKSILSTMKVSCEQFLTSRGEGGFGSTNK